MSFTLLAAFISLVLWIALGFVVAVPSGMVHVFLPIGVALLIRWWALQQT